MPLKQHDLILGPLNDEQRQAVLQTSGPVLILAGAGSGKTRALTHRIAHLMGLGVEPWQILAVTFTNKAATEMKERIKDLLHLTEGTDPGPWEFSHGRLPVMGTFHAVCARILRRDIERLGRDRSFVIYDRDDQERLMKSVLKELHIEEGELKPRAALASIGRFKSEALSPREALQQAGSDRMHRIVQTYERYQKRLREGNAVDFDDLILETVRLFHECPDVLDRYQETWRYLHVDEYQDTNHAQYLFITLLAQKYRNLCVIGDPDQAIYGFRGADIRNILEFEQEYKDAKRIKLERNYRSTQPILSAADAVIAPNPNRPEKKMWTDRADGPVIVVHETSDEKREAEEAIRAMQDLQKEGTPWKEQAILYRTHAQSRLFEEACMRAGVPYRIFGGVKFYARKEVKDVLAYLHVLLNSSDTVSLLRILNVPARKIGDTTLKKLQMHATQHHLGLWETLADADNISALDEGVRRRIGSFVMLVRTLRARAERVAVRALATDLLEATGMEQWLREGTEEGEERWRNVQELLTVMHKYDALEPAASLTSFLEEVALVSEVDRMTENGGDALTLMTLHLCKGLEFEHVIVVGCEEGLFPHANSLYDKEQLEEERRLLYVGMTRARSRLRLMLARNRYLWGENKSAAPSRFLDDLPEKGVERRSDDLLSAFAWAGSRGLERARQAHIEPFRQEDTVSLEFNQDPSFGEERQDDAVDVDTRIEHPVFGRGTVLARRGDVVDISFDSGKKKTFALSIAPLKVL